MNHLISENLLYGPATIGAWMLAIQKVYRGTKLSVGTFTTLLPDSSNKTWGQQDTGKVNARKK